MSNSPARNIQGDSQQRTQPRYNGFNQAKTRYCHKYGPRVSTENIDSKTVASFGDEWLKFDQSFIAGPEAAKLFEDYFALFPWKELPDNAEGFDMGCGSGRWAAFVAPRVGTLHCIEPSDAIEVAKRKLSDTGNVAFHRNSVDNNPLREGSQDFGYCLGVLHHMPDTEAGIRSCVRLLKPGAPLLLYIYYSMDNRPALFRWTWRIADSLRRLVVVLPPTLKQVVTDFLALTVYLPLARICGLLEKLGCDVSNIPLSFYRNHSFYTMRTDSRDRFGTPLERRFSRGEIARMMANSGLTNIRFSETAPYWCAVGEKS